MQGLCADMIVKEALSSEDIHHPCAELHVGIGKTDEKRSRGEIGCIETQVV